MRSVCWTPLWHPAHEGAGLEHLRLSATEAHGTLLAIEEDHGPFELRYHLTWDAAWQLKTAHLVSQTATTRRELSLHTQAPGRWHDAQSQPLPALDGCHDIDIWPTPFTNTFPLRRALLAVGERREFRMAWVAAPLLTVQPQAQAYTRLTERRYLIESLDGSGFQAELPVDEDGLVLDYPRLFRRVVV